MYLCQAYIGSHRTHRHKKIQAKRYPEHKYGRMVVHMNEGPNNAKRLRRSVGYLMPRLDYTPDQTQDQTPEETLDQALDSRLDSRLDLLRPSQAISDQIGPSQAISDHLRQSQTISHQPMPFQTISDHLRPYQAISDHFRPSQTIHFVILDK